MHAKRQIDHHPMVHNLPLQPTPFIGRNEEISEIGILLADPACRLLTLVGPGGIGKTRLAIESATRMLNGFAYGVYFVPLQPIRTYELLITAIAHAAKFSLAGSEPPSDQLINFLQDKEILLVLDNFEQLLSHQVENTHDIKTDGTDLLIEILQAAPGVKLLVTSREILNLQPEWVYTVEGMVYPRSSQVEDPASYSAVQLFVERAKRIRKEFTLAKERDDVVHICQLVEGMPLALELSASWIKTLNCAEIASEIQQNLKFLATNMRDVPDRHQNMQAVFEYSWAMLTNDDQRVFKRLSVFRSGFQRSAAEQVAGATLTILSDLVDKSLLRRDVNGRYQMHELLRQYAEEQLKNNPEEADQVQDLHCACYAGFLHERLEEINDGKQLEAVIETESELENIRAAWQWAAEHGKFEEIYKSLGALIYLYQYQSRYLEGAVAFEEAVHALEDQAREELDEITLAELLNYWGWLCIRLGRLDLARSVLEKSWGIYQRLEISFAHRMGTDPRTALGVLANSQGDYAKAASLGEEAYRTGEEQDNKWNMIFSLYVLTNATIAQGNYPGARQYAQKANKLAEEINDSWFRAFILNDLGNVAFAQGLYAEAHRYFQASYTIRKEFNDPGGMAEALNHLGKAAVLQKDYTEANNLFRQSLSMYQEINDKGGVAGTLDGLGLTASGSGDYPTAGEYFTQALKIAIEMQFLPLILSLAINVGGLWFQIGHFEKCVELLTAVLHHPSSDSETIKRAEQLTSQCQNQIQPEQFNAAQRRGQTSARDEIYPSLLADPVITDIYPGKPPFLPSQLSDQNLIEPLTSRELEVLQLITEGLSNKEIAEKLVISLGTVKWHNHKIYNKLDVGSRTQAIARAGELELLP